MHAIIAGRSAARGLAAALALGLAANTACATATTSRYRALRDDWQRAEAAVPPTAADDALFAGSAVLERAALVHQVLARNPSVHAARQGWRAALARYPQVTALEDPRLGGGVGPRSFGTHRVDEAYKVELSQALPFPGKLALRGQAALAEAEAAAHDFAAVRLRLAAMASLLFDDYYVAARARAVNAEHVALLESFQRIATARYEAGEASQQDPLQAEAELAHAMHDAIVLETQQRIVTEQVNALLHRASRAPLPPPPDRTAAPEAAAEGLDHLVAQALEGRPELAAASARVAREQSRVDLARREYFPDLTVSGAYDRFWDEPELRPFVGVSVNVPIQLRRRAAAVEEAEARLEQARSERLSLEDEVRLETRSAAERIVEAQHVARLFSDRLVPAARDRVAAARSGFETGRNSFLALIDAERSLRDAELGYEQALANLARRRAELDRAVGRIAGADW